MQGTQGEHALLISSLVYCMEGLFILLQWKDSQACPYLNMQHA